MNVVYQCHASFVDNCPLRHWEGELRVAPVTNLGIKNEKDNKSICNAALCFIVDYFNFMQQDQ